MSLPFIAHNKKWRQQTTTLKCIYSYNNCYWKYLIQMYFLSSLQQKIFRWKDFSIMKMLFPKSRHFALTLTMFTFQLRFWKLASACMPFAFQANLIKSSTRSYYTSLKYCCKKQPEEPLPSCFRKMHNSV